MKSWLLKAALDWLWSKIEALLARWKHEQELVEQAQRNTAEDIAKKSEEKVNEIREAVSRVPSDPDGSIAADKLLGGKF